MSLDTDPASVPSARCPSCGARNSADAVWCSLCFCSMTEQPAPPDEEGEDREPRGQEVAPPTPPPPVEALLAELAAGEHAAPAWRSATRLVSSPGARVAVMLLGAVLVTGLGFAAMAALGALL